MSDADTDDASLCSLSPGCSHLEGHCCPTAAGIRLRCCLSAEATEFWGWGALATAAAVVLSGLVVTLRALPRSPQSFRREVSVALTSALVYTLMSVPFFWPDLLNLLDANVQAGYIWLPFWYAFVLTTTLGSFFEVAACSAKGTLTAVAAMTLLNYLLPGGATAFSKTAYAEEHSWTRWLGQGYHGYVAWIFTACFVYSVFLARWNGCMKQYCLGFYSSAIVDFMNPKTPSANFRAVLWDYNFQWNWKGQILSSVFITLAAIPLAGFSLPIIPCYKRLRRFYSCRAIASKGLAKLVADTWGSVERLITYFSEDDLRFDTERSYVYIRNLGKRRQELEAYLEQAKWECYNDTTRARRRFLTGVVELLRNLRQGLRVQLVRVRQIRENPAYEYNDKLGPHLNEYVQALKDGMGNLTVHDTLHKGLTKEQLEHILTCALTADAALAKALGEIPPAQRCERIFVDCLRNFSEALRAFAEKEIAELEEGSVRALKSRQQKFTSRCQQLISRDWLGACCIQKQHVHAVRNTTSWLLALAWSAMVRRATCVTTVSFVCSPALGSLFDRNINRILGVGLGLALGNLPTVMLLKQNCYTDQCFLSYPSGPVTLVLLMFAQWACSMYGYLATGSKYSYACLLWAGFGGVQMLRSLHLPFGESGMVSHSEMFVSTMDNMLGCFIVFGVDVVASHLLASRSTEQVALHISQIFLNLSDILDRLKDPDCLLEVEDCRSLVDSIKAARYWDEEARKEDSVWTSGGLMPYKPDLADAVLRQVDDIIVALWSLLTAAKRSKERLKVKSIAGESLPADLQARCRTYSREVKKAFCGARDHRAAGKGDGDVPSLGPDSTQRRLDDFLRCEERRLTVVLREACGGEEEVEAEASWTSQATILVMRADCHAMRLSFLQTHAVLEENLFWEVHDRRHEEEQEAAEEEEAAEDPQSPTRSRTWFRPQATRIWVSGDGEDEDGEDEDDTESSDDSQDSLHHAHAS